MKWERAKEWERERERESFRNQKPYLTKVHGLESTPTVSLAASESEKDRAQPDDVSSVMYLPSLTMRSSGIRSSSLLSMMLWCGIPIAKLQNYDKHAEGFETWMLSLYPFMCYKALVIQYFCYQGPGSYEIHYKCLDDGFGSIIILSIAHHRRSKGEELWSL